MAPEPVDLDELRQRLRATQEAAERIAEQVPPQGWATPEEANQTADEIQALVSVLRALRDTIPDELWEQVREIVRQLLLLLRAVLDLIVERLGSGEDTSSRRRAEPAVQDIPIA